MELARGICTLCSDNTKVLPFEATEEFTKHLPAVLYASFLPESQKIKHLIKACAICCYKIQLAVEAGALLKERNDDEIVSADTCHFCQADKCLVKVDRHWKYFSDRAQGFFNPLNLPICACSRCVFYFDTIFNFKTKLSYKFPQLVTQKKKANESPQKHDTPQKQNDTPKRKKSTSKSPPSSKKRKIFDNCFAYLQPLCNNTYQVENELQRDERLYTKVAYVNLTNSKDIYVKETPKTRPVIKIKLKPKHKRSSDGSKSQPFMVVGKSEEIPKEERHRTKRRHSVTDGKESPEEPQESIDETPKSASVSNLVPKRRVSVYMDNGENEEKKETVEEDGEEKESENKVEETVSPASVSDEETPPSPAEPKESTETDENGIDKPNEENIESAESAESSEQNVSDDVVNGEVLNSAAENDENKDEHEPKEAANIDDNASDISSSSSSRKSPSKSDGNSEGNNSDTSTSDPKNISHDTSQETDVLNGSERKKKKVTFSDEVNN